VHWHTINGIKKNLLIIPQTEKRSFHTFF